MNNKNNENKRIDLTQFEGHTEGNWCISDDGNGVIKTDEFWIRLFEPYCDDGITEDEDTINKELMVSAPDLIAELKRCYKEFDELPTRWELMDIFDYQKWLEYVESCFLADGSFNQDADFVRKCAVNEKYGYHIEVIDGVETVVHESEY